MCSSTDAFTGPETSAPHLQVRTMISGGTVVYTSPMTCSIDDCLKPTEKRGWCATHYRRWQRHGDPLANNRPEMVIGTLAERFWPKVAVAGPEDCWLWLGTKNRAGYGSIGRGGRGGGFTGAHRAAYELTHGPIAEGLTIDHLCRNKSCVNPSHLEPVTQKENNNRGPGPNATKTHCKQGHPFDAANTIYRKDRNMRQCKTCLYAAVKRYRIRMGHDMSHV